MSFHSIPKASILDVLCPMHAIISSAGEILHIGPTLAKLETTAPFTGQSFFEVFHILRPREVNTIGDLSAITGTKLHLELQDNPKTALKGVVMRNSDDAGFVINFSFGIAVVEAVQEFDLSSRDFAATDLTVEMLYLIEAKSAAMTSLRKLTHNLQGAKDRAETEAYTDALTGLRNRRALDFALSRLLMKEVPLALMHIDLDLFKNVNDTHGHAAGDYVLRQVADAFTQVTRSDDIIARVGGDEFIVVMPECIDTDYLELVGKRIIARVEAPIHFDNKNCRISCSIGTVIWDGHLPVRASTLISNADIALYASKRAGKAQQTLYSPYLRQSVQDDRGTLRRSDESPLSLS